METNNKLKGINWKYALGEIVIVILGISIAFSLNQWAENAKHQKKELKGPSVSKTS